MAKVVVELSMSLDGFIAGPNDSPENGLGDGGERLFKWYSSGDTDFRLPGTDMVFKISRASADFLREPWSMIGASVTGRRTFDIAGGWGGNPPGGPDAPYFVVTHTVPQEWVKPGSPFTFVTEGVERAVEKAKRAAGDNNVDLIGASIVQQCLKIGLVDEIQIDLAPVLLGGGVHLFNYSGTGPIDLERIKTDRRRGCHTSSLRCCKVIYVSDPNRRIILMSTNTTTIRATEISLPTAYWAIATSGGVLLLLAILHIFSPEFDPSWRMVSEYANGQYSWVLSLMFALWALSSWILALMLWSQISTTAGKVGLFFLILAGVGEAMASVFDINHPLHGLASIIGIGSLPIAAMLISVSLGRTEAWSVAKKALLWTANLTWISILLMVATFIIMIVTFTQSGAPMPAEPPTTLPPGVIGLVGWTNRILIVAYCEWVIAAAWLAIKVRGRNS